MGTTQTETENINMSKYYDGTKLLSLMDINGQKPEIYMSTSNRSAGKTTYFNKMLVNRFKKNGDKFILIYRFNYELTECAPKFFKEIGNLFFKGDEMTEKKHANGIFVELFLNEKSCGYCISLNFADQLKKYSHLFADASAMLFDEFQSETNHYCPNEVEKLLSIHTSIARGGGEQVKYMPVYMISNAVSIINPYYMAMNIADRLQKETRYLRGDGWVLEQGFYDEVSKKQTESAFNRAFAGAKYVQYASENVYLLDKACLIEKMQGKSDYIATVLMDGKHYAIRNFIDRGILYIDNSADETYKIKFTIVPNEQNEGYELLTTADFLFFTLKSYFLKGKVRFKNQECKSVFFTLLKFDLYK